MDGIYFQSRAYVLLFYICPVIAILGFLIEKTGLKLNVKSP